MQRSHHHGHRRSGGPLIADVYHRLVSRHRVEIEVWPARAQVHFRDDWLANPADKQIRFEATVYNSSQGFLWEVRRPDGTAGLGTIDETGVYHPPVKGSLASGTTEVVVATAREDRLRKAYAWLTLVGEGPEPAAVASIDISPRRVNLYYWQGASNQYIDASNKMREFHATLHNGSGAIQWLVNGTLAATGDWFLYQVPNSGGAAVVRVRAQLAAQPSVFDEARILQLNYSWP